ncbi:hypothetical protein LDENG_00146970 [Lucifuga dentata]|nr:hypothetical protein LDENG_00146970 [Lucifuga dentata]
MKLAVALAVLSVVVLGVVAFQALSQELNLRTMKIRTVEIFAEIKNKEAAVVEVKTKIQKLKLELTSATTKIEELNKKKAEAQKPIDGIATQLEKCNAAKENHEKNKIELENAMAQLTSEHEEAKLKAEEESQLLKHQILDRDLAICAFVDPAKSEGLKLCGMSEAAN